MTRMVRALIAPAVALSVVGAPALAQFGPISSPSFFDGLGGVTMIDFETDGSDAPVILIDGQTMTLPASEYASSGFSFDQDIEWVNDGNPSFNAAQMLEGIGPNSIPGPGNDSFSILFSAEVRSVAFWIANNFEVDSTGPIFSAFDDMDQLITSVTFGSQDSASIFVEGRVGAADYGFMGIFSQAPIARLEISKDAAILDDLIFSDVIPSPGALALGAIALGLGLKRPRRLRISS